MAHRLITPPVAEPVSLADVKADLRIDHTDDDVQIQRMITDARQSIDGPMRWLSRALMPQTWELLLDEFPSDEIRIPCAPVISVVSVKYDDTAGIEQTVPPEDYQADTASEPAWLFPVAGGWSVPTLDAFNAVRIRYVAGYADADAVPGPIKQAIRLMVRDAYDATDFSQRSVALLTQFRLFLS